MKEETKALATAKKSGLEAVVNNLFATKTPAQFIKTRPGPAGLVIRYVEIGYVISILNNAFGPFWEFKVVDKGIGKKQIWVQGQLTIKDPKTGFSVTKETFGGSDIKISRTSGEPVDIANDLKAAVSDCTKKCASMFGIAADVFFKEQDKYDQMDAVIEVKEDEAVKKIVMSKFFAVAAEHGYDGEAAKTRIKEIYKVLHMEDLTIDQMEKTIEKLQNAPKKAVGEVKELKEIKYFCKGSKHDATKPETMIQTTVENAWCSKECQLEYYPEEDKSDRPWEKWKKPGEPTQESIY